MSGRDREGSGNAGWYRGVRASSLHQRDEAFRMWEVEMFEPVDPKANFPELERRVLEFGELFDPARGVAVLVVTLLAVLELARESLLELTQSESFAPIYVKLAHAAH